MARFSEQCPKSGSCEGVIEARTAPKYMTMGRISAGGGSGSISLENGVPQGPTQASFAYFDQNDGMSRVFTVAADTYTEAHTLADEHIQRIEDGTGPLITKKFLGLVTVRTCCSE